MDPHQQDATDIEEQLRQLEEAFNRKKAELEARRQMPLNTGGGAIIQGDVTAGRDFVNWDKYEEHYHYHNGEGPAAAQQAEAAYRQDLANYCDTLPLRGVDPTPGEGTTGRQPLSLAQVYIALDTQRRAPAAVIAQALQRAAQGQLLDLPELSAPATTGRDEDT